MSSLLRVSRRVHPSRPALRLVEAYPVPASLPFDSSPTPLPSMADWIDSQAESIRSHGSDLARWLADHVADIAANARELGAETPDDFDGRSEVMAARIAEHDSWANDAFDAYPLRELA